MCKDKIACACSILIPTMNRPAALKRTLDCYVSGNIIPSQIVVVDQSQDVKTAKEVKEVVLEYSKVVDVKYVYQEQASLTKARNNAFRYATNEIIICSDDDVDVYNNTLENVCEIMSDENIAMIAGINDNTQKSKSNIGYLLGTKSFAKRKIGHVTLSVLGRYPDDVKGQIETQWAMGYFFVVRKSLLNKWNIKWDENLTSYAYAEDLDFSYSYYKQSKKEGLKCVLDEKVRVLHLASKEYRVPSKKSTYMYVVNRAYISYKHNMGMKSRMAMAWCNFWRLVERIIKKQQPEDLRFALKWLKKNMNKVKKGQLDCK